MTQTMAAVDTNHVGKEVCKEMNIADEIKYKPGLFIALLNLY